MIICHGHMFSPFMGALHQITPQLCIDNPCKKQIYYVHETWCITPHATWFIMNLILWSKWKRRACSNNQINLKILKFKSASSVVTHVSSPDQTWLRGMYAGSKQWLVTMWHSFGWLLFKKPKRNIFLKNTFWKHRFFESFLIFLHIIFMNQVILVITIIVKTIQKYAFNVLSWF